jgi:hypothetical protein
LAQLLTLNNVVIKKPTNFGIEKYNLTKAGRTTDGTMHLDLIAKKRKFTLSYDVLRETEHEIILGIIDGTSLFFTLTYVENNTTKTATVYAGAIKATQYRTQDMWYWKDVTFDLIEQ